MAPPNGDGDCLTDMMQTTGGSSQVPKICGENSGQHVYVDFNGEDPITISVFTSGDYTFNRQWQMQIAQIACESPSQAPSGCLQYHLGNSGTVSSFNYASVATSMKNSIGMLGTRLLANIRYGICVRMGANKCSITWKQVSSDIYSFTMTGDVGVVDTGLLGTFSVQQQTCTSYFVIIPNPIQNGTNLSSDRFCGMGLLSTTSGTKPFILYINQTKNITEIISTRGFYLQYSQNSCPII